MKKIFAIASLLVATSVYAQSSPMSSSTGSRHMFEFNADSVLQGVYSFDKSKTPGSKADNDSELNLALNYAYQLMNWPKLQLGGRANYLKDTNSSGDLENYSFMVGVIANHSDDLPNSFYASLYGGLGWNNEYGGTGGTDNDELITSVLAVGKRFSMENWGLRHLTYTPEVALFNQNSTTGGDLEYAQSIELRFLQFSVFF